jgi:hypothetical protein
MNNTEASIQDARAVIAGDPVTFGPEELGYLLAELDRRGAAIERVREFCTLVQAEGVEAVTIKNVLRMLDGGVLISVRQ